MPSHVLLVEDSEQCQKIVRRALGHYSLHVATSVDEALLTLRNQQIDLILLDIELPQRDGFSLLNELQAEPTSAEIPVICLTGKTQVTDKVTAFSLGADEYLGKPFDPIELRARVDSILAKRERRSARQQVVSIGGLEVDHARHRASVRVAGTLKDLSLTPTEFKLLGALIAQPERVFTRDQLLVAAWGEDASVLDRAVDVHLCGLRRKLGALASRIEAVPGVGYRYVMGPSSERAEAPSKKKQAA